MLLLLLRVDTVDAVACDADVIAVDANVNVVDTNAVDTEAVDDDVDVDTEAVDDDVGVDVDVDAVVLTLMTLLTRSPFVYSAFVRSVTFMKR